MLIREIENADLQGLLSLYTHLHDNEILPLDDKTKALWCEIMNDPNHHIVVGVEAEKIIASCVLVIVPNFTHNRRPYALIENVLTHSAYRGKGYGTQILNHAKMLAAHRNCYKIMLMTGSQEPATLAFYERAGYNQRDKTAFIQWLE